MAGQIECSMVCLREFLITTTIIEEIPVDPMELLNECQMAYLILIQVGSLLTTMALRQERVGVGLEYRRKHHWVCYMECLTALLIAHPTDPPTI